MLIMILMPDLMLLVGNISTNVTQENQSFFINQSWLINKLDLENLNLMAKHFKGKRFFSFSKYRKELKTQNV